MLKIFTKQMNNIKVDKLEVNHDLGIEIAHDNKIYTLQEDNYGRLILNSSGTQLVLKSRASNSIQIDSEE